MAKATWQVDVEGQPHTVVLEWTYFGGERHLSIDGHVVDDDTMPFRWSSEQPFTIDGHNGRVVTRPQMVNVAAFDIELYLAERLIQPVSDER